MILWLKKHLKPNRFTQVQHARRNRFIINRSGPQNFIDFNKWRNVVRDQEVDGSNSFAPTYLSLVFSCVPMESFRDATTV